MNLLKRGKVMWISIVLGLLVVGVLAPSGSAYYTTSTPPALGYRGMPPVGAWNNGPQVGVNANRDGECTASADITGLNANFQWHTGGAGLMFAEELPMPDPMKYVWFLSYDLSVTWSAGCNVVRLSIVVELWQSDPGLLVFSPVAVEQEVVVANQANPTDSSTGWIYLYNWGDTHQWSELYTIYVIIEQIIYFEDQPPIVNKVFVPFTYYILQSQWTPPISGP